MSIVPDQPCDNHLSATACATSLLPPDAGIALSSLPHFHRHNWDIISCTVPHFAMLKNRKTRCIYDRVFLNRGDWTRTSDLTVPNRTRYRAALRPEQEQNDRTGGRCKQAKSGIKILYESFGALTKSLLTGYHQICFPATQLKIRSSRRESSSTSQ